MPYTIGEMARMLSIAPSTLRYYDKEGLLPFVERSQGGMRVFKDADYEWLGPRPPAAAPAHPLGGGIPLLVMTRFTRSQPNRSQL